MVSTTKPSRKPVKETKRATKPTTTASPKSTKSKVEKIAVPSSPSTKPQATPKSSSSSKFISNALNKPKSESKKAAPAVNKTKLSKPSDVKRPSKLAPPADSAESPDEEEDADEERDGEEDENSDKGDDGSSEGEEDTHLHGFSSSDNDSSDDDDMDVEPVGIDVGKLPTIAKDDESVKRKLDKAKKQPTQDRGVIYLGRLPHGFFEAQLKAYFSQFGDVTRLRVSRNKRTGHSKHRAFLEFDSSSVAQIVAETMDNYLLMGHLLICKVIPKDEVHPELWIGANRKWRKAPTARIARQVHNKPRTEEEIERATKRLLKRQNQKKRKLAEAGINYNMDKVAYKKPKSAMS
ncbi:hypothetical protein BDN71DRAFT_1445783 [Pleurotus eryngii]|uniref:RRM domain-containing protein n=1 Tax=Pleurotus eryngii TaxID=5323 RepID=A0A9P6A2X4_PLEER|nr:hypothetical protein BDN71DRAFT_1445783 [Pleurotus eryngii]